MRTLPLSALLLALMLSACSTRATVPPSKHIAQEGALRVHPDLVGQPAQATGDKSAAPAAATPSKPN